MKNPYRPIKAEVLDVIEETPTISTVRFKPEESITFATGQFVEITIPGVGEAPFTPSSKPSEKKVMEVTVMKVGKVTKKIHELKKGDVIGVRGPFGKGYPVDDFRDKEILVVGGGCGFAPLRSLMYELFHRSGQFKKLFFRGGCKTSKELVFKSEIDTWAERKDLDLKLTVDVGDSQWKGNTGVVTTILENIDMDCASGIAIICGPPIMMKFATKKALEMGFKEENIYLSMEKNMSCGIGKCGHCRLGTYYACKDGPVFTYDKIKNFSNIWD
ncbi:MAG: FAD/NAD(P)-binding protein [Candidatus Omnitrophica bacterium]|nr:FAD/NAD(P)-binding protein [Candidatus Omnitrophota bacterium]MBU1047301.1 FAD/NAD(P)-binding protein [Candidatus Omnitrophota bacterium]MBU1630224.1 FAD/NAD(P)-binding protein [Candidatus Omnitrophota bacterium]MBU1889114.1 FAD/NAD(P)-binding protein [Candidatus Omnitrophota bacterium]